jgi:Flp pilus assembly protein TadG
MEGDSRAMAGERGSRHIPRARARRARRGQATLEFAFAAPLFLLCLFATVDAALWSVQTNAEVAAVENAARAAASAGTSPLAQTAPDARAITQGVTAHLGQALFGTRVVAWCDTASGAPCAPPTSASGACNGSACRFLTCPSTPQDVQAVFGPRVVAVCVHEQAPPPCATTGGAAVAAQRSPYCSDPPTVTVRVIGFLASLVPPGFGAGESGGELPTDIAATTHTLRFAP